MLPSGTLVRNWSRSRVVFGEDPESTLDDRYLPVNTPPLMTMNPAPAEHDGQGVVVPDAV